MYEVEIKSYKKYVSHNMQINLAHAIQTKCTMMLNFKIHLLNMFTEKKIYSHDCPNVRQGSLFYFFFSIFLFFNSFKQKTDKLLLYVSYQQVFLKFK